MHRPSRNAGDAGASELSFELFPGRLEVRHDGRPFDEADALRGLSQHPDLVEMVRRELAARP